MQAFKPSLLYKNYMYLTSDSYDILDQLFNEICDARRGVNVWEKGPIQNTDWPRQALINQADWLICVVAM